MPELPEVETIVRELKESAVGKVLREIKCLNKSSCRLDEGLLNNGKLSLKVLDVIRRGKFIVIDLERDLCLVIHLRMTGRVMWHVEKGRKKYVRAIFEFNDGLNLFFSDVRKFGKVWFFSKKNIGKMTGMYRLGPEPFKTDLDSFKELFGVGEKQKRKKGILKNTLLRQDFIAGIGNIYADEICFGSGLHPSSRIEKISEKYIEILYDNMLICLEEGIKNCGVSVSDFVGTKGDLGKHQNYLKVYGRAGDSCYKCGFVIKKIVVAGRGTHFCDKCQKKIY